MDQRVNLLETPKLPHNDHADFQACGIKQCTIIKIIHILMVFYQEPKGTQAKVSLLVGKHTFALCLA